MRYMIIMATLVFIGCSHAQKQTASSDPKPAVQATQKAPPKAVTQVAAPKQDAPTLSCKNEGDTRLLEIVKKESGCALKYTKSGKSNEVASSSSGTKHCEESLTKIRGKLEKAGFDCKEN